MKKFVLIGFCWLLGLEFVSAQNVISQSDTLYHKNSYGYIQDYYTVFNKTVLLHTGCFKRAVDSGSIRAYGIALTYVSEAIVGEGDSLLPGAEAYWVKLCTGDTVRVCDAGGVVSWSPKYSLIYDSLNFNKYFSPNLRNYGVSAHYDSNALRKDGWFAYQFSDGTTRTVRVVELYFNSPKEFDTSYYVSGGWSLVQFENAENSHFGVNTRYVFMPAGAADTTCSQHWYDIKYDRAKGYCTLVSSDSYYPNLETIKKGQGALSGHPAMWGFTFPITGLRCTAPLQPTASLENGQVAMRWNNVFTDTAAWQVSVGVDSTNPENNTLVVLSSSDTAYLHTAAPTDEGILYVRLRRGCRYCTADYDSVVWSNWSDAETVEVIRCGTPMQPEATIDEGKLHISWTDNFRDTATWQLSIGPDSMWAARNTLIEVAAGSTEYVFDSVPAAEAWYVRLRRLCHYKTAAIDTNMRGGWSEAARVDGTAGLAEAEQGAAFSVSPNPTKGLLEITLNKPLQEEAWMAVMDLTGREWMREALAKGTSRVQVNIADLPKGSYLVRITAERGTATRRVVKL